MVCVRTGSTRLAAQVNTYDEARQATGNSSSLSFVGTDGLRTFDKWATAATRIMA